MTSTDSFCDRVLGEKSTNPKRAYGVRKPSAQFIPPIAIIEEAAVMALGAAKYGAFNWQDDPVDATTYYSAAIRHLLQWFSGEYIDQESGASHLAPWADEAGIETEAASPGVIRMNAARRHRNSNQRKKH